jgi:dihydrofolate reductase
MAAYWPSAPREEIADRMDSLLKVVVSGTLQKVEWNNSTLMRGNLAEEITKLKAKPGKDIVILGLVPILLGCGHSLFSHMKQKLDLKLEKTEMLHSGVAVLYYQRK